MFHSVTHGNGERGAAAPARRGTVLRLAVVAVSTVAFMALYEFVTTLLFPSITLWESHFITIGVSGAIATAAAFFVLRKVQSSAESYRQLVEEGPDAMLIHRQGEIIFANSACASLFGASSAGELLGKQMLDFVHPDDREAVRHRVQKYDRDFAQVRQNETRLIGLHGTERYADVVACSIIYRGRASILVMYRDISKRKKAEQELRQSEANLSAAQAIAHVGNWSWDIIHDVVSWSAEMFRIWGVSPATFDGKLASVARLIHPEDLWRQEKSIVDILAGKPFEALEYRIIRPDGSERVVQVLGGALDRDVTGLPTKVSGVVFDVTERKRAEERFYKAFNASPEPLTITSLGEGRHIDVNENFLHVTGYQLAEVIGRTSLELKLWEKPEDRARLVDELREQGSVRDMEIPFRTKSGEQRVGLHSVNRIEFAGQECMISSVKDITKQKALEKQLRQAQKMEAVGQLSGGIAHDFNNLLSIIIGYSDILEENLDENNKLRKSAREIKKAGQRAASLTRQLLAFSRQQVLEPKVLNLNTVVAETEKMLERLIGENIELTTSLSAELGQVKADQVQIEQVILNLAVNARDAMPDGGKLIIETRNVELDEEFALRHPPTIPGNYVALLVTDTGIGMDAQTQAHIFEPFFTTKEVGKGTGLGLATVYGVVKQSGGYVWVYSEPGLGSTFKVYLPRVDEAVQQSGRGEVVIPRERRSETILLVEDEESLRTLTRTFLEQGGYTVLEANDGQKAIEIAQYHQGPIHLLLTDMIMPGMSGRALAESLARLHPELKVIYISGYTGFTNRGLLDSQAVLLSKPVTREVLLSKLHEVLNLQKESTAT